MSDNTEDIGACTCSGRTPSRGGASAAPRQCKRTDDKPDMDNTAIRVRFYNVVPFDDTIGLKDVELVRPRHGILDSTNKVSVRMNHCIGSAAAMLRAGSAPSRRGRPSR